MTFAPDEKAVRDMARAVYAAEGPEVADAGLKYMRALAKLQRACDRFANAMPAVRVRPTNPANLALQRAAVGLVDAGAAMKAAMRGKRSKPVSVFDTFDAGVEAGQAQRRRERRRRRVT